MKIKFNNRGKCLVCLKNPCECKSPNTGKSLDKEILNRIEAEENECVRCGEKHMTLDEQLNYDDFSGATYLEGTGNSSRER